MHRWVATMRGAKAMGFVVILAHKFIPLLVCSTVLGLGREQIIVRNLMVMSSPMPGECDQWVIEQLSCSSCRLPPVALHAQRLCWLSPLVNVGLCHNFSHNR